MKPQTFRYFVQFLLILSMAFLAGTVSAQVYKTVDEEGNVTYTDTPPGDGSKPIKLAPISVIEAPGYEQPEKAAADGAEGEEGKEMSLRYLRKNYADFAIVAPQQEESVWNPESAMTVAWNTRFKLQPGMQVTIYVDGKQQARTTEQIIAVTERLDRGEHRVEAQLTDAKNRKIATAEPVTFFVRRPGLYNNRPQVSPRGA